MSNPPLAYKLFCDESCHLEHDKSDVMVLGTLYCSEEEVVSLNRAIKQLRNEYGYQTELKWTKLIAKQMGFYKALIDLFMDTEELKFKATVVLNKSLLDHEQFNQGSHNNFYYKMFYYALKDFLQAGRKYKIYLDYMDTHGRDKTKKLTDVLQNTYHNSLEIQTFIVRSHESQVIQLCDMFIGALSYANRKDIAHSSIVKNEIIAYLEQKLCRKVTVGTPPWEEKFNIFQFSPRGKQC